MILPVAILLATAAAPSTSQAIGQVECSTRSGADVQLCLATQHAGAKRFADSATEFEKAAAAGGARADFALAAAGNMWIAAGEPGKCLLTLWG